MDGLNSEERELAWLASWHPSFDGKAIMDKDLTFTAVNPQFCKVLGVTPAELIDKRFTDVTSAKKREVEAANAELVMKRETESFLLEKSYEFASGTQVNVIQLVKGVYHPASTEFLFFVSTIMQNQDSLCTEESLYQQPTGLLSKLDKAHIKKGFIALIGTAIAGILTGLVDFLITHWPQN